MPDVQYVAGRSHHALIGADVDEQVQPAISLAAFKMVEALVVGGDRRLSTRDLVRAESRSLMHGSDFVEANEIAPETTTGSIRRPVAVPNECPNLILVFDPRRAVLQEAPEDAESGDQRRNNDSAGLQARVG